MLLVLDTNVIVSALLSPNGKPAKILEECFNDIHKICVNDDILAEYSAVLRRPKFGFDSDDVDMLLERIESKSLRWYSEVSNIVFIDKTDKKFYDLAKTCKATLITGNKKHYPNDSTVLSPSEFE